MNTAVTPSQTRTVAVGHRLIHLHEFGAGPALLMLHGGGPGASGLSNYVRNVDALARHFRVLVPDLPGYGKSSKGVDASDPFGDQAGCFIQIRHEYAIDDETRAILDDDRRLAEIRGPLARAFESGLARGWRPDNLDQRHLVDWIEKVQPGDSLGVA